MNDADLEPPRLSLTDVFGLHDTEEQAELAQRDPFVTLRGRPSDPGRAQTIAFDELRRGAEGGEPSARIEPVRELGRGGMGVVYLAEQRSLGRLVAVKTLREDVRARSTSESLLQEAWMLGAMEHPNVVPVYDLRVDEHGDPMVVLKRIEGESWLSLVEDEARVREAFGAKDVLEWHLSVLMQVCNALSFAHSRGVIHRDVKPENVMVGRFGEVYLVDWGVAVALEDDGTGRFPLARQVQTLAGTPRYMAPEMLGGRAATLGVHTDIYLLGATLFHVLAGRAPHQGETIMQIAGRLALEDPALPEGVPPRLAEICRTAMARDPARRYASADAFRAALADYLRRRDALVLAEEGERKLAELKAAAAGPIDDEEAHRLRMFNLYSESRLGFRLARRLWPESAEVSDGLRRVSETMISYLIDRGDLASATTLIGQLQGALSPELAARYEAARHAETTHKRHISELEALGRDHDPAVGRRARFVAYAVLALLFVISNAAGQVLHPWESHRAMVVNSLGLIAALVVAGVAARKSLLSTTLNRDIYAALFVAFGGKLLVHATVLLLEQPPWHGFVLTGLVFAAVGATLAIRYQALLWPVALAFAAAAIAGAAWPDARYVFFSLACVVMLIDLALVYRVEQRGARPKL